MCFIAVRLETLAPIAVFSIAVYRHLSRYVYSLFVFVLIWLRILVVWHPFLVVSHTLFYLFIRFGSPECGAFCFVLPSAAVLAFSPCAHALVCIVC